MVGGRNKKNLYINPQLISHFLKEPMLGKNNFGIGFKINFLSNTNRT